MKTAAAAPHDEFYWITEINKATVVVESRSGLIKDELARQAARGIAALESAASAPGAKRPASYIAWEPLLIEAAGQSVTAIHAGRSSQDILSTMRVGIQKERALAFARAFDAVIDRMIALADANVSTIVPSYTNGVAAQPTSWAHTLLGFLAPLLRERVRLREWFERFDRCPMGATVLNGTCWPLDRSGMAEALGFTAPVRNAFDATCEIAVDSSVELSQIAASVALHFGSFLSDVMVQYAQARPWILLAEGGENTYVSSAMPQKRNPGLINNCRGDCSDVVAEMAAAVTRVHNLVPGMVDGKSVAKNGRMSEASVRMCERFLKVLNALRVNPERALEELNSDWTASQEIADRLMRDHGLPFRIGHHMASRMVSFARERGILPLDFPYAEMRRIYAEEIAEEFPGADPKLPMTEDEFHEALDPRRIVEGRRTSGSCAPAEVAAMIHEDRAMLADLSAESERRIAVLEDAFKRLDAAFERLL